MTAIAVRRLAPDDGPTLKEIRLAALADAPSAFASTFEREVAFDDAEWAQRAGRSSTGDEIAQFLAWRDGRAVGLVGGMRTERGAPVVELVAMWVAPDGRRAGTGRALVDAVVAWAAETGAGAVDLWVTRGNAPAEALYRDAGFAPTGDHQPLPSDPCRDEVRLRRALA